MEVNGLAGRAGGVELLSPAGDEECFGFAMAYGADAVYLGAKDYGMRAASTNFSLPELAAVARRAHSLGRRVYLTVNTVPANEEIDRMPTLLEEAAGAGVDAFIIADLGVLALAKKYAPKVEVHFSTQVGIANYAAARMAYDLGAKRVVLARELALEEIHTIRAKTPPGLELEVFVHGAMCMSISGRCLLSHYMAGRDGNRGKCAQSCRWKYALVEEKRPGEAWPIGEDEAGSYILSADDLCTVDILDQILAVGASSLKIEGRAKSFYYVASATAAYRAALDAALAAQDRGGGYQTPEFSLQEVEKTSHRPYSHGFYLGRQGATNSPRQEGYIRTWQIVGVVQRCKGGYLYARQRGKFSLGEELELLLPSGRVVCFTPEGIWNEAGEAITATPHTKMEFYVKAPENLEIPPISILRKAVAN